MTPAELWEREAVIAGLKGVRVCPIYFMPCWVCTVLHALTGTLRSAVRGKFERLRGFNLHWAEDDTQWQRWFEQRWSLALCPHHPGATGGPEYFHDDRASRIVSDPLDPEL